MTLPNYRIRNARLIDPRRGIDQTGDLVIRGGAIAPADEPDRADASAPMEIDASGCLVTPGLIDFHAHLAQWQTDTGVNPDLMALPNGITAAVDAGSTGTAGAEGFVRHIIANNEITIRLFVNVSAIGVTTEAHSENPDPARFDAGALARLCERHPDDILGLKIRLGKGFSDGWGVRSLARAKEIAKQVRKPLCVHIIDPEFTYGEALDLLDGGDILCHCYQGRGHTVLDPGGKAGEAARRARGRGVVFDAAVGRVNHDFAVIAAALADGFPPDVISTDVVATSVYQRKLFHLLHTMSMFLALGLPLPEVVRTCTDTPARLMGLGGRIGTLAPGSRADVAIFKIREKPMRLNDQYGHAIDAHQLLVPQATFKNGRLVYKQMDFEY